MTEKVNVVRWIFAVTSHTNFNFDRKKILRVFVIPTLICLYSGNTLLITPLKLIFFHNFC
jgi:hypothetical protein